MITWDIYPNMGSGAARLVLNSEKVFQLRVRFLPETLLRGEVHFIGIVENASGNTIAESPPLPSIEAAQRAAEALLINVLIDGLEAATASVAGTMPYADAARLWRRLDTASNEFERRVLCAAPDYPDEED